MDFKIVIIDDNLSEKEPFVQNIRMHYKDADYNHVFQNPDKGLEYVLENLNSKMIVFIDWNFSGHHKKGIDLLKEIRKKTSLLYIVMMSANQLRTDIPLDSIIEMMNEENFSLPSVNPWQFWISTALFVATFYGTKVLKINPIRMICWAGFAGLILLY